MLWWWTIYNNDNFFYIGLIKKNMFFTAYMNANHTYSIHIFTNVDFEKSEGMSLEWNTSTKDDENSNFTVGSWLTRLINLP